MVVATAVVVAAAVIVTAAVVVVATPVVATAAIIVAAVLAAAAGALDLERDPGAVLALDDRLDVLGADLQAGEAVDPLEARVARDLDANGPALDVAQAERARVAVDRDDGALELPGRREAVCSGAAPATVAENAVRATARTVKNPISFMLPTSS